mgnify:CR=1 FL=1
MRRSDEVPHARRSEREMDEGGDAVDDFKGGEFLDVDVSGFHIAAEVPRDGALGEGPLAGDLRNSHPVHKHRERCPA